MRGCAVLEDAETDAIEAGAEEVNVTDEKSGTLEFVSPDNDLVTVKGCLVKAGYECQDASIAYFPNVGLLQRNRKEDVTRRWGLPRHVYH